MYLTPVSPGRTLPLEVQTLSVRGLARGQNGCLEATADTNKAYFPSPIGTCRDLGGLAFQRFCPSEGMDLRRDSYERADVPKNHRIWPNSHNYGLGRTSSCDHGL